MEVHRTVSDANLLLLISTIRETKTKLSPQTPLISSEEMDCFSTMVIIPSERHEYNQFLTFTNYSRQERVGQSILFLMLSQTSWLDNFAR